jgi:hypothetical protein
MIQSNPGVIIKEAFPYNADFPDGATCYNSCKVVVLWL